MGNGKGVLISGKGKNNVLDEGRSDGDGRFGRWEIRDRNRDSDSEYEDEESEGESDEYNDEESDEESEYSDEEMGGDHEMEGDQEMDNEDEDDDADRVPTYGKDGKAPRGVCYGDYKKRPVRGAPKLGVVEFLDEKIIKQPTYKRTLKGILRAEWKYETAFEKGRLREKFLDTCVRKFRRYYYYPDKCPREVGNSVVKEHLRRNMKQNMFIMKKDANKMVEEAQKNGDKDAKRHDFKPYFLDEDAWRGCCDYWNSDGFKKRSKINTENRKHLDFAHGSGAMPFEQRSAIKESETGELISELDLFHVVYKKKRGELIKIQEALEHAHEEWASLITADESRESRKRKNILCTLKARKPKNGRVFMHSRHSVQELIGPEEASAWTSNCSTPARIPDHAYGMMKIVMNEVSDMVEGMDGDEIPRSRLDQQLKKLVDATYPNKEDPVIRVLSDQYYMIATNLSASLFERSKKVIIEDTPSEEEDDGCQEYRIVQRSSIVEDEQRNTTENGSTGSMNGSQETTNGKENTIENDDQEGSLNETPLSP